MKLVENIKNKIGTFLLRRETGRQHIKRVYTSLDEAFEIGIIYNGINIDHEAVIHKYAAELRSQGKKIFLMGYVDLKTLPGNKKFSLQSEYYWREKLNLFNLPDKAKIGRFLDIEFDLLLNLYEEPLLPLQALSAYAKANYRVGPKMVNGTRYMDAMIDTGSNKSIPFLIEQIDFYLRIIQSPRQVAAGRGFKTDSK